MPNYSKAFTSKLGSVNASINGQSAQPQTDIENRSVENPTQSPTKVQFQPSTHFFSSLGNSARTPQWEPSLKATNISPEDRSAVSHNRLGSDASSKFSLSNPVKAEAKAEIHSEVDELEPASPPETEPIQMEPTQTELKEAEPIQAEPIRTELIQAEPIQAESIQTESIQTESIQAESPQIKQTEAEPTTDESPMPLSQVESDIVDINQMIEDLEPVTSTATIELEDLDAELQTILTPNSPKVPDETADESDLLATLLEDLQLESPQTPESQPEATHDMPLSEQFDHIISHFAGNNRDRDDIAALPIAAALINAAGLQEKSTFFYNNSVGQPSVSDYVHAMRQSAEFAETLGIQTYDYEAGLDKGTQKLADRFNSGQKILVLEGGHMEMTYRALENTNPTHLANITLLSHSKFNEDYSTGGTRTWSDLKRRFPAVQFLQIRDQTIGFRSDAWSWLDASNHLVLRQAHALMQNAKFVSNAPCDAGMHFYVITGNDRATPLDVQAFFDHHAPAIAPPIADSQLADSTAPLHALHLIPHPIGTYVAG
ncbi:MAG: hypothetical protein VKL39_23845 [Leptolyngbyaceae bacterium]|nr:hypothetical protein [Leptolyngbyaceae bacterium]